MFSHGKSWRNFPQTQSSTASRSHSIGEILSATQLISPAPTTTGKFRITNPVVGDGEVVSLFDFNGVSSKKTGRVVFLRRGRRSARFKHR